MVDLEDVMKRQTYQVLIGIGGIPPQLMQRAVRARLGYSITFDVTSNGDAEVSRFIPSNPFSGVSRWTKSSR